MPAQFHDRRATALSRRRLLLGGGALLLCCSLGRTAQAFSFEEMNGNTATDYEATLTCRSKSDPYHDALVAETMRELEARGEADDPDRISAVLAATHCPLCGCSLNLS